MQAQYTPMFDMHCKDFTLHAPLYLCMQNSVTSCGQSGWKTDKTENFKNSQSSDLAGQDKVAGKVLGGEVARNLGLRSKTFRLGCRQTCSDCTALGPSTSHIPVISNLCQEERLSHWGDICSSTCHNIYTNITNMLRYL